MTATATKTTRRTDWLQHSGLPRYRIWKQFDGLRWFQRHEWERADGGSDLEDWIPSGPGWVRLSTVLEDQ